MNTTNLSVDIIAFLDKPTTQTFLSSAQQYIEIIEKAKKYTMDEFMEKMQPTLIELYLSGLNLEEIELKYSSHTSKSFQAISDDRFDNIHKSLVSIFSDNRFSWVVPDPMGKERQQINKNWIDENFEQIYLELKDEIGKMKKFATNEVVEDAFYQIKRSYKHFWGDHCINAIQLLHFIKYKDFNLYTLKVLPDKTKKI